MKKLSTLLLSATMLASLHGWSQTIFTEDFEGGALPAGWTQTTSASDGGWLVGSNTELQSAYFPIEAHTEMIVTNDDACDCSKDNDLLITPSIDLTGLVNVYVKFDLYYFQLGETLTLEVSTDGGYSWNVVTEIGPDVASWATNYVDISSYAGMSNVMVGFRYDDNGTWAYGAGLDNISVMQPEPADIIVDATMNTTAVAANIDAIPALYNGYLNYVTDGEMFVNGSITSNKFLPINSFDVTYTNGADTYTQSYSGLDLGIGQTYSFIIDEHPMTVKDGANNISVTLSNINGGVVENTADNTTETVVNGVTPAAGRVVIAEEATGTWCGWCVRGAVMMNYMAEKYPDNFIGIAVHNADPMVVTEYDNAIGSYPGFAGYPSGFVDRGLVIDPTQFESAYMDRIALDPEVIITEDVTVDYSTRIATVVSNLDFQAELDGDYRIAVVFTEDEVTGVGGSWGQHNYYSGGGYGPMGGYEDLAATVPAASMVYEHVARAIIGTFNGVAGSVPATNAPGSSASYTSTYTIPEDYDISNMHAITLLIKHSTGELINAGVYKLTNSIQNTDVFGQVTMYPNPANDVSYIRMNLTEAKDITVKVTDITGKVVAEKNYGQVVGDRLFPINTINFESGIYIVNIISGSNMVSQKIIVSH